MIWRNLTPHAINICTTDGRTRTTIPSSGIIARAVQTDEVVGSILVNGEEIEVVESTYSEPIDLPPYEDGVNLVVSFITAKAAKEYGRRTDDLYLTSGQVRDENGNIVGCLKLARYR